MKEPYEEQIQYNSLQTTKAKRWDKGQTVRKGINHQLKVVQYLLEKKKVGVKSLQSSVCLAPDLTITHTLESDKDCAPWIA